MKYMKYSLPEWSGQFFRYFGVGLVSAGVDWLVFFLLLQFVIQLHYLLAVALAFLLATYVNYRLCVRYVFTPGRYGTGITVGLLYGVSAIGLCLDMAFVFGLVQWAGIPLLFSKVLSTGLVFFWNFAARKVWVFSA